MNPLAYSVDSGGGFRGVTRSVTPNLPSELVNPPPAFLALVKQVFDTGVPVHFSEMRLLAGGQQFGSGPGVMYRNDNPAKPRSGSGERRK